MGNLVTSSGATPVHDERPGVILVDPLPVVRAGLAKLLQGRRRFRGVTPAGTADEALEALEALTDDPTSSVVIVGLALEGPHDAFWLIEAIRDRFPGVTVVACGARSDATTISRALLSGADGFVDKTVEPGEFLDAISLAAEGELVLSGPPSEWVGSIAGGLERAREAEGRLTDREREVLNVAVEGLTAREIAQRLGVRERTVTTHLTRIYSKLGVRTRVGALRAAVTAGLVSSSAPE